MSDIPDAPGGEPADDVSGDMTKGESIPTADEPGGEAGEGSHATPEGPPPAGPTPAEPTAVQPSEAPTTEWWRRDPEPPRSQTSVPTPPGGTPHEGTPPEGTPPFGMPPFGAPSPGGSPTGSAPPGTPPPGTPPWATAPWGTPPWGGPQWGGPQWGGPPPWYGWGPGWPGSVPPSQAATSPAPRTRHQPLPWVIIGCLIAAFAMVAIGLGIGYSVWGATTAAVTAPARGGVKSPAPRIAPGLGRAGFLGVEVVPSSLFGGATPPSATAPTRGAYVVGVVPSSPAAKAGIVKGDTITTFAGRTVNSAATLRIDALDHAPGTKVKVAWVTSSGKHESATVTLASRPKTGSIG